MRIIARGNYNLLQIIQICLFFLVSLNFANLYFYLIFLTFFICALARIKNFRADNIALCLVLFSICYILFYSPTRDSVTTLIKQFAYPMCYLVGLNLFDTGNESGGDFCADRHTKLSIYIVAFGSLLHYLLNASLNIDSLMRNTVDYWTGEVVAATDQALLPIMAISVFSVWLFGEHPIWKKICALFGLFLVFAYNFVLAGRTIVVLTVVTMCIAFLFFQKHLRSNASMKNYLIICIVIVVGLILFLNNLWGIRDWIIGSNLSQRFDSQEVVEDIRWERKIDYMRNIISFPIGGGHLRETVGGYAHELYLDVLSDVGIIGYILVITIVFSSLLNVIKNIKRDVLSIDTKCLVLCVFIAIAVAFLVEPIIQSEPWFFCSFCFLSGVLKYNLRLRKLT